jgi:putative copper export protein
VGFRILLGSLRGISAAADALVAPASERAAAIGRGALVFLLLASGARLLTQFAAIGVSLGDFAFAREILFRTVWGWGWLLQVIGAIVGFAAFHTARRSPEFGWRLAAVAAVLLAVTPALSGHAAGVPRLAGLAVLADSAHVLAIAGWLGTLILLVGVGLPEAFRADAANGASAVAAMVRAFSPAALTLAGIAAATGLLAAVFQLNALQDLWTTPYGRMLLVKLGFVAVVVAAGAWNWRRIKPRLASADDAAMLRKSATVELAGAAIVLLVTAILVALPTP